MTGSFPLGDNVEVAIDAITESAKSVALAADPDDKRVHSALLLAYEICMQAADRDEVNGDRWTFAALAIRQSYDRLTSELPEGHAIIRVPEIAPFAPGDVRALLSSLISQLVALFTRAVNLESLSPWRRLTWFSVITQLDQALRELS
ncbi:hypothetical protein ABZ671_17185 [Micromonospora sp. NPDC006766]|uniref:hypothetical protein n=1 Tax=Micromonospora sp. NPDC006766 TaxID=3154778 RepID=UPI00340C967A